MSNEHLDDKKKRLVYADGYGPEDGHPGGDDFVVTIDRRVLYSMYREAYAKKCRIRKVMSMVLVIDIGDEELNISLQDSCNPVADK